MVKFWKVAHPLASPSLSNPTPDDSNFVAISTRIPTKSKITPTHANSPPIRTPAPATMIRNGAKIIDRPASISGDEASTESALLHALENINNKL